MRMHEKISIMTKVERKNSAFTGLRDLRDRQKFNEKFPDNVIDSVKQPIAKTPSYSSVYVGPIPRLKDDCKILTSSDSETKRLRRHTWTFGLKSSFDLDDSNIFQGLSLDRRRSSASSAQDVIEELPDEEIEEEDSSTSFDYMKCKNCSQDGNTEPSDILQDDINFCFNCKHLYQNKNIFNSSLAFDTGRRSSWAPGDKIKREIYRQSSCRGSLDLPSISEPIMDENSPDEDDEDEKEMQKRVQKEVEKLIKFKSNNLERRKTIGCEKDIKDKKLTFLRKLKATRSDPEPGKLPGRPDRSSINVIKKNSVSSMKKHFLFQ